MAGRQEFEAIVAQAPQKSMKAKTITRTTVIAAGAREDYDLFSSAGTVATLKNLSTNLPAPIGATTGKHSVDLNGPGAGYVNLGAPYGSAVYWNDFSPAAGGTYVPNDLAAFATIITNLIFSDVFQIRFTYQNDTDVAQNGTRIYNVLYVEDVVKGG